MIGFFHLEQCLQSLSCSILQNSLPREAQYCSIFCASRSLYLTSAPMAHFLILATADEATTNIRHTYLGPCFQFSGFYSKVTATFYISTNSAQYLSFSTFMSTLYSGLFVAACFGSSYLDGHQVVRRSFRKFLWPKTGFQDRFF